MPECVCTNDAHGGKLWKCGTEECLCQATFKEHCQFPKCDCDRTEVDHPNACRCEVCRFWS